MARPKIELTETHKAHIEEYAGKGCTLTQIALMLDVSDSTLDRWIQKPEVKRAYQRGRAIAHNEIAGKLFDMARSGDVAAAIFYLKAQAGWSDKPVVESEAPQQVQIYLPSNGR